MTPSDSSRKSNLIAIGTTVVIAVYAAGFLKTKAAAAHFADQDTERRRPAPTVHPEIPVAATITPAAPRPEQPAAKAPSKSSKQTASAQAPKADTQVAAAKSTIDSTPVAPPPAATTPVAPTPPRDTTPTLPKPVAVAPTPAPTPTPTPTPTKTDSAKADSATKGVWKDGLYFGWGRSRHGDIQAGVEIKAGRIASAFISECLTQYSCSWISHLPPQVVARQSADVDYVSGATQSTNAFYYAVVDALEKGEVTDSYVHTVAVVGTVVTVHIVGHGSTDDERRAREEAANRAVAWFEQVERVCSRFDPASELSRLASHPGEAVAASAMLYEAVRFALAVAAETDGAFDPTVGAAQQARGFDREHRSGQSSGVAVDADDDVSYRDVMLGADRTITLARPLLLDLGAVAKGLAIDLAARELAPFENFAIDAGGDLYLAGHNAEGAAWSVGIRHPRDETAVIATLRASNAAVCTSGDYEQRSESLVGEHHIVDPRTGASPRVAASATVQAPSAMVADALATAAFVLGPDAGIALLERQGVDGFIVTPSLERFQTAGLQLA